MCSYYFISYKQIIVSVFYLHCVLLPFPSKYRCSIFSGLMIHNIIFSHKK
ncbi:hypothetical protein LSH36_335g03112 [Paralvinella palmiformis]|uniref:Uncharacterized protein n=1 Tax=Paralvinella palmiformis TaxID=53620 RepID=A0AAD9JGK6_9ANNE|nr:hypothetical protein LSH36_335g03112 [Paralvinella palmiformis]